MSALNDMGINVVENAEASDDDEEDEKERRAGRGRGRSARRRRPAPGGRGQEGSRSTAPTTRSACTCARWARSNCSRREGEIAIAKRIEAGRDIMIWGLCESPITFNAIIGWSNALNEGRMQLREILDLEAMLSKGPTAEQIAATEEGGEDAEGEISEKVAGPSIKEEEEVADEPEAGANEDDEDMVERRTAPAGRGGGRGQHLVARPDGGDAQAPGAREVRRDHLALQEILEGPGDAHGRARARRRISPRPTRRNTRSCASSSPPRSRASSSTAPRSNIWSSSSTATTAA